MGVAVQDPQYPARHPGEPRPQPQIRLSDADRNAVIEILQEAFSQGRLDEEELDDRTGLAMKAKFGADLDPLTEDLIATPYGGSDRRSTRAFGKTFGSDGGERMDPNASQSSTQADRLLAATGHAGNYFFPVVAPLVLFLVSDRISPYVRRQAMEALNFQLFCLIVGIASLILSWLILPIVALIAVAVGWMVLPAIAGIVSLTGGNWRYPMFFRVIKDD